MLDTKLKNRHKLAVFVIFFTILIPGLYTADRYREYYRNTELTKENLQSEMLVSEDFLEHFVEVGFVLHNTGKEQGNSAEEMRVLLKDVFNDIMEEYDLLYPYLDYCVENKEGNVVGASTANTGQKLTRENIASYPFGLVVSYDENGTPDIEKIYGKFSEEQSVVLRRIFGNDERSWQQLADAGEEFDISGPVNKTYYYAMTDDNLKEYISNRYYDEYQAEHAPEYITDTVLFLMLFVAVLAWIYPRFPSWRTGNERIFQAPFEAVLAIGFIVVVTADNISLWFGFGDAGRVVEQSAYWALLFAAAYWVSGCIRQIYVLKPVRYMKERTILFPSWKYIKRAWEAVAGKVKECFRKLYHVLEEIDFREEGNKAIFKIVLCNFIILAAVCVMWVFGIMALIIYSVILFFVLRKYYNDLREKYQILLKATNQIAGGNLEVEITEDLGVFAPFRTEIEKIQAGFRKAVAEEVKSQRMKSDLITNVSHDLKTPLTAIITYVNLLKEEKDEEKQREYIEVLERKSLRLKALIEDLFEISKASSKNITLQIVEMDIVNLFKQVKLELEDKLKEAEIEFRCSYPEERLLTPLDSQKTYRIFENLLVNISKYAMPHTRAYVEITREEEEAVVRIKNISAAELTFNPEEISERFVRGDVSRNTEGSGLGLAIAKSFTELQKGKFRIETEADLFRVELRFGLKY